MNWLKKLLGLNAETANCVPRAFANAMTWAITKRRKVFIADFLGHWQACGENDNGELEFLEGNGWDVWLAGKEGAKPMVKLWNLRDAMEHFIEHNPWAMPTAEEQAELDERIEQCTTQSKT